MPEKKTSKPQVAESPIADVFERRHPSQRKRMGGKDPILWRKRPRNLWGAHGVNRDEHGHARFTTISGTSVRRLYTPADLPDDWSAEKYLAYPGQPPFTRGIHASGYRGKLFTMRQFSGFASPEEPNQRYKYLLESGGGDYRWPSTCPRLWATTRSPRQRRRSRQVRRRHRFARGHGDPLRWH